ncbi:MAG: DUF1592 domain-containing protein [Lentisphaeraceae bacterium]|nr:DUF1592 domain-containing protein [Lentisphaeraceae bacterium]
MNQKKSVSLLKLLILLVLLPSVKAEDKYFETTVKPFLDEYCIRCHGEKKQKGDRRYDMISSDFSNRESAFLWQDMLDQLHLGEMPPKKPFPTSEKQEEIVAWITTKMDKIREEKLASKTGTVMRRLSHKEFSNTLYDLFEFNDPNFLMAYGLPEDSISHGFNNNAKELKTTSFLYEKYLRVADKVLDNVVLPRKAPKPKKWTLTPEDLWGGRDVPVYHKDKEGKSYADLIGSMKMASRCWVEKGFAAPIEGTYKIRIKAQVLNRNHEDWKLHSTPNPKDDFKLGVYATSKEYGQISADNISDYHLKTLVIGDDKVDYEVEAHLKKGFVPYMIWLNGVKGAYSGKIVEIAKKRFGVTGRNEVYLKHGRWKVTDMYYRGSRIRVYGIEIEGPFFKEWPPQITKKAFDGELPAKVDAEYLDSHLTKFASKAWRRPVKKEEISKILELTKANLKAGDLNALKIGMKAILVSPGFLYHYQNDGMLNDYGLASRLSYFLWGTSPNQDLMKLAANGKLTDSKSYEKLITKMVDDPKTNKMLKDFAFQWLNFGKILVMQPDKNKFKSFYSSGASRYITEETNQFLVDLLRKNKSVYNCIDSDYVMVNGAMAKHYGLKGFKGSGFKALKLPPNSIRGGLITQASVLAATSNGVDTSPVTRGVWVMENLLGTPPPAPPADVEPLEPDIRGATTLVEQLKKHREMESCSSCHKRIDPLGMPLENFDAVGKFRTDYGGKKKLAVEATTVTSNGTKIENIIEYKKFLMENKQLFAKCLTEKLLSYATGRDMTYLERGEIDNIAKGLETKQGFRDLLITILKSNTFKSR